MTEQLNQSIQSAAEVCGTTGEVAMERAEGGE